jgi:hypothetical protein
MILRPLSERGENILMWLLSPIWAPVVAAIFIERGVTWVTSRIGRLLWRNRSDWSSCFAWWPKWCQDPDDPEDWGCTVWLEQIERCEVRGEFAHQRYVAYRRRQA